LRGDDVGKEVESSKQHRECPFKGGQSVKNECPFATEIIAMMDRINRAGIRLKFPQRMIKGKKR